MSFLECVSGPARGSDVVERYVEFVAARCRPNTVIATLSEHRGDARPDTLIYLRVPDVDAVAKEFDAEIIDQPWGREVHLTDPDGNRFRVGTPSA